jgi:hypothetical protein
VLALRVPSVDVIQNIPHTARYAVAGKGYGMKLRHVNGCSGGTCPTVFETDRGTYVVQGAIVTDPEALASVDLPAHETLVEVPTELLASLKVEP